MSVEIVICNVILGEKHDQDAHWSPARPGRGPRSATLIPCPSERRGPSVRARCGAPGADGADLRDHKMKREVLPPWQSPGSKDARTLPCVATRADGKMLERAMGIEPTTYSLGSCRSTTELRP